MSPVGDADADLGLVLGTAIHVEERNHLDHLERRADGSHGAKVDAP
jgi:hypothetical protein